MSKRQEHISRPAVATVVQRAVQGGGRGPLPGQREVDAGDRPRSRSHGVLGAPLGQPGRDRRGLQGGPHEQRARGARAPAQGGAGAARGARHPPAGHGFFRQGDPVNVYPFIEAERVARVGNVRRACILLKVSRAAYYAWSGRIPCGRRLADEELLERIVAAHKASRGTYGSPRITRALRAAGLRVSRKRSARLMALRGLAGRARRRTKRTTVADPLASGRATDLLRRNFAPGAHEIDTLWCGDISYVRTWEGWAYLATVIDLSSRLVFGLAMADHLRASLAAEALAMAVTQRRPAPGLVFHSDSAASTPPLSSAGCSRGTASCSHSQGPDSAGTTPWRRASSPRSRRSCSTAASGRREWPPSAPSSSTSRSSTTASAYTPPWATSRRWLTKQDGGT